MAQAQVLAQGAFCESSELRPSLAQYLAQNLLHLVELCLTADQWRSDLEKDQIGKKAN